MKGYSGVSIFPQNPRAHSGSDRPEVVIVVPVYNEAACLAGLLREIRSEVPDFDIVVVDDGSTDRSAVIARMHDCYVIQLPFNLGIGGAVQTGFRFARSQGYRVAVQVDGDGQHPPSQIRRLVSPVLDGLADVTIGSRFLVKTHYRAPFGRRVGMRIFQMLSSCLLRRSITDCTSGFRAYSRSAIEFLSEDYPIDYPEPESVVTLARAGLRIREVPVEMRYRQGGSSSITNLKPVYYMVKVVLAILIEASREPAKVCDQSDASCFSPDKSSSLDARH